MLAPLCHYFLFIAIKNAEAELGAYNQKSELYLGNTCEWWNLGEIMS